MHPAFLLSLPLLVRPVRLAEMSQVLVAALALKKTKKQKAVQWCNLVVHKVKRQRTLSFLLLNSSAGHLQAIDVSLHSSLQNWQLFLTAANGFQECASLADQLYKIHGRRFIKWQSEEFRILCAVDSRAVSDAHICTSYLSYQHHSTAVTVGLPPKQDRQLSPGSVSRLICGRLNQPTTLFFFFLHFVAVQPWPASRFTLCMSCSPVQDWDWMMHHLVTLWVTDSFHSQFSFCQGLAVFKCWQV